tara:strand:- start:13026 stop:13181 length:156 start_codon:yes stop_codon:yes gene_type:complete
MHLSITPLLLLLTAKVERFLGQQLVDLVLEVHERVRLSPLRLPQNVLARLR